MTLRTACEEGLEPHGDDSCIPADQIRNTLCETVSPSFHIQKDASSALHVSLNRDLRIVRMLNIAICTANFAPIRRSTRRVSALPTGTCPEYTSTLLCASRLG